MELIAEDDISLKKESQVASFPFCEHALPSMAVHTDLAKDTE